MSDIVLRSRGLLLSQTTASNSAGTGRERVAQLRARGDPELRKDPIQVRSDRAMREEQPLADLPVRQALGGQLCDLQLLCCEPVPRIRCARSDLLARRA